MIIPMQKKDFYFYKKIVLFCNLSVVLSFFLTMFFTRCAYSNIEVPQIVIDEKGIFKVSIRGQKQLNMFFDKIKCGIAPKASCEAVRYYRYAKKIEKLDCSGKDVPTHDKIRYIPPEIYLILSWVGTSN